MDADKSVDLTHVREVSMQFGDIQTDDYNKWITPLQGELYADTLIQAAALYAPVLERFGQLLRESSSATDLYQRVMNEPGKDRNKLIAVFRHYFTLISTEVLGKKKNVQNIVRDFGEMFRDLEGVKILVNQRPFPDEALMTILYRNAQRGVSGYELTKQFFEWFENTFDARFTLSGPRGRGSDLNLKNELDNYLKETKADFLIRDDNKYPLVVGFARYDAHRGGSQETDRIKSNNDYLTDIMEYSGRRGRPLRVLFVNDGLGLTAGKMWNEYANLEKRWESNVIVATLKMLSKRVSEAWIEGR